MSHLLPPELWSHIFSLASDEDIILYPGLPTSFVPAAWYRYTFTPQLTLRTPQKALCILQCFAKPTKTSIVATCKAWRGLGTEVLMRCLFFSHIDDLFELAGCLAADPERGRWTRRLHVEHYGLGEWGDSEIYVDLLRDIIQHFPNLEIFILDWRPMALCFGDVAGTLGKYCRNLRTAYWHATVALVPKVIWVLDKLPNLVSVHLQFSTSASPHTVATTGELPLGVVESVHLTLPTLQELSLHGHAPLIIKQASGWSLPSLRYFSFESRSNEVSVHDVVGFLAAHGARLVFLDLNCITALDFPTILDLCPVVGTFCFNPDWPQAHADAGLEATTAPTQTRMPAIWKLVNRPHAHITQIGLHGLLFAFGVGLEPLAHMDSPAYQRANDIYFGLLASREAFPRLERVRVLCRVVLSNMVSKSGPSVVSGTECRERWERWCGVCEELGVRLEDCTGALLKDLPSRADDHSNNRHLVKDYMAHARIIHAARHVM
ncbi:hypothetical protein BV22DRAFT_1022922 [Leucogyrophana mollusca]|uniref:Uncharacterized protein n=1 Tax=Leucogyrophana mollusca TaxID=85980 RepID=A0ACB8B307_9AGAM|nr:hypothetical protein BV22DRAFT_1022922 [Leucogyrophana mollusca]